MSIATCLKAVGTVLIKEEDDIQKQIYYVSHTHKDVKTIYPNIEKFAYALVIAARKLWHIFRGGQPQS